MTVFLYVIAHKNKEDHFSAPIKIGYTNVVSRRLKELQTGNPKEIGLFAKIPFKSSIDAKNVESLLHEKLKDYKIRSEWFDIEPEQVFSMFFSYMNQDINHNKSLIENLWEHTNNNEYERVLMQFMHWEVDEIWQDVIFSKKISFSSPEKLYGEISQKLAQKYKDAENTIEKIKKGDNNAEISYGTPYWKNLANRNSQQR